MKILICYFSGTGNTEKVVHRFKDCFQKDHGAEVKLARMEDAFSDNIDNYDIVGIGYPVHAFNAPSVVLDFCKKLPFSKTQKRAFIVNTSGEPLKLNNISSLKTASILKRRNIVVSNEFHYCMPYNMIFRHGDHMAFRMWDVAQKLIPLDAKDIINNKPNKLENVFMGRFIAWIMRCEHWGGRLNGRLYKTDDKCVNCNMCVNVCPTKNITVKDGKIKFGGDCLMCMRCAHLCGKDAIKTGLFNSWKVNGRYTFEKPDTPDNEKYNRMLTKAYKNYFQECEFKIAVGYADLVNVKFVSDDDNAVSSLENESAAARI